MHAFQMLLVLAGVAAGAALPGVSEQAPNPLDARETAPKGCPAGSTPTGLALCNKDNTLCQCGDYLLSNAYFCGDPAANQTVGFNPIYPTKYVATGPCVNGYCQQCTITCPCLLVGHVNV